ncbi:MAG: restriction endonuclease [Anaerolineaceae bacterium]
MANKEFTVWGIHAGKTGDAENLFLKKNIIALGWNKVGDLSLIKPDRENFKVKVAENYPEDKPGSIPVSGGQLFRFTYEIKPGDLVVFPAKRTKTIHIGQIKGDYQYIPNDEGYPNTRAVIWLKELPRTAFTQGALYEIGSAMSLFQVKNYADEFIAAIEGKETPILKTEEDESVAYVVDEIEQTTRDYILKRLSQQMKGHPLAHFVAHLLQAMGYRTRISPEGADGGIDIIAHTDELGFEPPFVKVEVKSGEGTIGEPAVARLYGVVGQSEFGMFITLSSYTNQAINFARNKTNLRLIDGDELVALVLQHYEQFDSRYKGLLPLKKVYIPDEEAE